MGIPKASRNPTCSRGHQIGALLLVVLTALITRIIDRAFPPSAPSNFSSTYLRSAPTEQNEDPYGSRLSLKIYVYEDHEIEGLRELMRGRDGTISPDSCLKGQWGTQVMRSWMRHYFLLFLLSLFYHP